ncbi:MAG: YebC/PmpR family DNA-binding transcriptional regulator [Fibrobacteria bacterium]|nr:YebC/PmpR family DNA-binding transcriptional regulator [Fibrobacteria bacterium]
MSGHSKWATTKRKKARIDGARAKVFNRIIREVTVAARMGGSDISANARLKTAVLKAKSANMPAKNIETAIAKGANELEGVTYFEPTYEGYGPGGISIMVDCMTDNKTRTVANIRNLFSKNGGNMAEPGSVAWMFDTKGVITLSKEAIDEEMLLDLIIEAGAEDLDSSGEEYRITMEQDNFSKVMEALTKKELETTSAEISRIPQNTIKVESNIAKKALNFLNLLDEEDDVQNVFVNAEFDDKDLEDLD